MSAVESVVGDRSLWESRTYTPDDLSEMERLGREKLDNANSQGTLHINRFRSDRIGGYIDGFKGEWAVADSLGIDRRSNTTGRSDGGVDLLCGGWSIQVRYTPFVSGRLMCPMNRPLTTDVAVLVVGSGHDKCLVWIVGGISVPRFFREAHTYDWGYGPTLYVVQQQLTPWLTMKDRLKEGKK